MDSNREMSVAQRLDPTITAAKAERNKAACKAKWTSWAFNIVIGLQVAFGALTIALGAVLSDKHRSTVVEVFGGVSTLLASYLARARGWNEPEYSHLRVKALDHFLREVDTYILDHGHDAGREWDEKINGFRLRLENVLGNPSGNVAINSRAGTNSGQDSGVGPGLGGNGKYPVSATNPYLNAYLGTAV